MISEFNKSLSTCSQLFKYALECAETSANNLELKVFWFELEFTLEFCKCIFSEHLSEKLNC